VLEALRDTDVRAMLPLIRVPTLVVHRRGDRAVRVETGRHLAGAIPMARLIELEGDDHWPWAGDQDALVDQIRTFAAQLLSATAPAVAASSIQPRPIFLARK
jgi:pimeloyl-ACP methyl ester carboxylesterase